MRESFHKAIHDHEHFFPVEMKWEGVMGPDCISLKEKLFFTLFFLDDSRGREEKGHV